MLSHRPGQRNRCINYSSGPHPERWFTGSIVSHYSPFSDQIRPIATTTALPFLSHEPRPSFQAWAEFITSAIGGMGRRR